MDFEMHGIGCAFCGRPVASWHDGWTLPYRCPTPPAIDAPALPRVARRVAPVTRGRPTAGVVAA